MSTAIPDGVRLFLYYGNETVALHQARFDTVAKFLPPEERGANTVELRGPGTQALKLEKALGALVSELGTVALIPGTPRVVIAYDVADLYNAPARKKDSAPPKGKTAAPKADPVDSFLQFIASVFRESENVLIFVCEEDEDKNDYVNEEHPIVREVRRIGHAACFRERPIARELEDRLYAGDLESSLRTLRRWQDRIGSDSTGRMKLYKAVAGFIELLLQAKCALLGREQGVPSDVSAPPALYPSVTKLPDGRKRQLARIATVLSMESLRRAVDRVHKVQRLLYPAGDEAFVADWYPLLEQALVEVLSAARAEMAEA